MDAPQRLWATMLPRSVVAWIFRPAAAPAVLCERVVDPAVAGAGVEGGGNAVGGADGHVAHLGAYHDRVGGGLGDVDVSLLRADLGGAGEAADGDVADVGGHAHARRLVDVDRPERLAGDVAETSGAAELGEGRLRLDARAGGHLDGHVDGPGATEVLVPGRWGLDAQDTVDVSTVACSAAFTSRPFNAFAGRTSTVVSVRSAARNSNVPGGDVEDGGDRSWGVELLHGCPHAAEQAREVLFTNAEATSAGTAEV